MDTNTKFQEMLKKYTRKSLKDIPLEDAHGGAGFRQTLVDPSALHSTHFEAMTKGILQPKQSFDWHKHDTADEMFIVLQGQGKFFWEKELIQYQEGDVVTIPANTIHKISAEGPIASEFFFVRVKA